MSEGEAEDVWRMIDAAAALLSHVTSQLEKRK
jgi:hypothetical protein